MATSKLPAGRSPRGSRRGTIIWRLVFTWAQTLLGFALMGGLTAWVAPLLSVYNYGQRIKRAQRLTGMPKNDQIDPTIAFLLYFPGMLLIVPFFFHYWYVTKHQNMAMRSAGGLPYRGGPEIGPPAPEAPTGTLPT